MIPVRSCLMVPMYALLQIDQLLSRTLGGKTLEGFHLGIEVGDRASVATHFKKVRKRDLM